MSDFLIRFAHPAARGLAALSLLAAACAAHADGPNMIRNGSFELPDEGADGLYLGSGDDWFWPSNGALAGPRIIRGNIDDGIGDGMTYGATHWGNQYLDLAGESPDGLASDQQMVSGFVAGAKYKFTVWAANIDNSPVVKLQIKMDNAAGTVYAKRHIRIPTGGPWNTKIGFKAYSFAFASPVTGPLWVTLSNHISPFTGGPAQIAIDNVSLVQVSDDTPVDFVMAPSMGE